MEKQFTLNGDIYTDNGKGYFYRMDKEGKTRISKADFEAAYVDWANATIAKTVGTIESIAAAVAEGVAEYEKSEEGQSREDRFTSPDDVREYADQYGWGAEIEEHAQKAFEDATWDWEEDSEEYTSFVVKVETKITEKVIEILFPKKTKKAVRIGGFEFDHNGVQIILTPLQVKFVNLITKTSYWDTGVDSTLWIDLLCDELAEEMGAMTIGAMVSTLREKGIIEVGTARRDTRKVKWFEFTDFGKVVVARVLGL